MTGCRKLLYKFLFFVGFVVVLGALLGGFFVLKPDELASGNVTTIAIGMIDIIIFFVGVALMQNTWSGATMDSSRWDAHKLDNKVAKDVENSRLRERREREERNRKIECDACGWRGNLGTFQDNNGCPRCYNQEYR
jgi:hypothetical protein